MFQLPCNSCCTSSLQWPNFKIWVTGLDETAAQELTLKRPNVYLIHTREALRVPTAYSFLLKSTFGEFKLSNSMKANESLLEPFL